MSDEEILFQDNPLDGIDPSALHPHYRAALENLNRSGVPYTLIGALSIALIGGERLTRDIDAFCPDTSAAIRALYDAGFRVVSRPVHSEPNAFIAFATPEAALASVTAVHARFVKAVHGGNSRLRIDIWFTSPAPDRISADALIANSIPAILGGLPTRRACADDMIVLKRCAVEEDPERASKDNQDIFVLERYLREHGSEKKIDSSTSAE